MKSVKELQSFLKVPNYLSKFQAVPTEPCEPLPKLTSVKAEWTWNRMYQDLYGRTKMIKKDACMEFYEASRPLYLEMDASSISLGGMLLQVRDGMNCGHDVVPESITLHPIVFASKSLLSDMHCYSNIEQWAFRILHRIEKFHHYYFAKEVCIITDHKSLVAIISKDLASLSQ